MQPNSSKVDKKSKIYLRILVNLVDKFGNEPKTVNIIKEVLDKELVGKSTINVGDLN